MQRGEALHGVARGGGERLAVVATGRGIDRRV
jgi:hypothetical protein